MAVAGFISGCVTGSMVTGLTIKFLRDRGAGKRRAWDENSADQASFDRVQAAMPDLIQAMRINLETHGLARQFYVLPSRATLAGNTRLPVYYENDYLELREKLAILKVHDYIQDERTKSHQKYVMDLAFVELVRRS